MYSVIMEKVMILFRPYFLFLFLFFFFFSLIFTATPVAYGSSPAQGQIAAATAGLHHSNAGSETYLQPMLKFLATPNP